MKKRGQLMELVGIVIILGIIIIGTTGVYLHRDSIYVGDTTTKNLYKYTECKELINNFEKSRIIVYSSKELAEKGGYNLVSCK